MGTLYNAEQAASVALYLADRLAADADLDHLRGRCSREHADRLADLAEEAQRAYDLASEGPVA
jgi:hypothetical protein